MSFRFVLYLLSIWFLARFLSVYLAPLFRSGQPLQGGAGKSSDRQGGEEAHMPRKPSDKAGPRDVKDGDYLDFEEVR